MKLFLAGLAGVAIISSFLLASRKPLGFTGNIASLSFPTTTQSTGSATGSLFVGSIIPNNDAQYDLGVASQRWRNLVLSGSMTSVASSSVGGAFTVSGALQASSTLQVTGQSTFYGSIVGTSTFAGTGVYLNASTSVGNALTVTGQLGASSTLQASGLETLYGGLSFQPSNGTLSVLNIAMSSASSSFNMRGASSSIDLANNSSTTLRVIGQQSTSTIFASTTAINFGSRLILVTTGQGAPTCVQMYVSGTPAIGATVNAVWEGVACPAYSSQ